MTEKLKKKSMFSEYDVVLAKRTLSDKVPAGSKGAVLMCFDNNDYEIEFVDADGETLEVMTVAGNDLESA